jgi:hypothetical protein
VTTPWSAKGGGQTLDGEPCARDDDEFIKVPGLGFAEFLVAALKGAVPLPERVFDKQVMSQPRAYEPF